VNFAPVPNRFDHNVVPKHRKGGSDEPAKDRIAPWRAARNCIQRGRNLTQDQRDKWAPSRRHDQPTRRHVGLRETD
jgi:hypothetical protein